VVNALVYSAGTDAVALLLGVALAGAFALLLAGALADEVVPVLLAVEPELPDVAIE
jgi:predicted outer membrane lipoprotein